MLFLADNNNNNNNPGGRNNNNNNNGWSNNNNNNNGRKLLEDIIKGEHFQPYEDLHKADISAYVLSRSHPISLGALCAQCVSLHPLLLVV